MTLSPKIGAVAAGGVVLILLAGYFFFWRPGQPPPIPIIPEKTISDLEAANKQAAEERESLRKAAQAAAYRAGQAQRDAEAIRGRFRDLEAQMALIRAKRGSMVTTPDDAIKELKVMGWLK